MLTQHLGHRLHHQAETDTNAGPRPKNPQEVRPLEWCHRRRRIAGQASLGAHLAQHPSRQEQHHRPDREGCDLPQGANLILGERP